MAKSGRPRRKNLVAGLLLTGGNLTSALSSFLRNIIIARLISVEDFGIAATFALTVAMIEMASNLAVDRLLVQAPDGDDPALQATAQTIQLIQGAIGSIVLFLVAAPVSSLFGISDVTWAFQVLAVVPLIRGFAHLDRARLQREMRFGPVVTVETGSQVIATVLAVPLGYYIGDYRAMLWVVLIQMLLFTLVSFMVAERRYVLAWDAVQVKRVILFGWPLLANGFLMFGVLQGDRTIVGASFSMVELGWFSAAFAMTLAPTMVLAKVAQSFFLPQLASRQGNPDEFLRLANVCQQVCLLGGLVVSVGFAMAGASLLVLIFGDRYIAGASVVALLGIMQGVRAVKAGPTIVAISRAETRNPLDANLVRIAALGSSVLSVALGYGVFGIVISALGGELFSLLTSLALLRSRLKLSVRKPLLFCLLASIVSAAAFFLGQVLSDILDPVPVVAASIVVTLLVGGVFVLVMAETRRWISSGFR